MTDLFWRPWLTAPRDGTLILALRLSGYGVMVDHLAWDTEAGEWFEPQGDGEGDYNLFDPETEENFLGWMPFPNPECLAIHLKRGRDRLKRYRAEAGK